MYYEDSFHPNEENDVTAHQKKELNNIKSIDSGYGYVFRKRLLPSGKMKRMRIDCYSSGDVGTYIRNAENGNYYKIKVGTKEEDLFFKVTLATGELRTRNSSSVLFYDSPEQYEKHTMHELSDDIKNNWVEKKKLFLSNSRKQ
jgi:hypothetical protein